ncbi:hypothetical protein [Haloferula sp. BvORR071]|uniref:hypothetical protein n=1 Tax=Haloferula sp. BvORR071 TaxID=1396141 RepID=UPI00055701D2|nr:hypothetical protein [Haloferula sp. BvORR071]
MVSNKTASRVAGEAGQHRQPQAPENHWLTAQRTALIAALGCIPFLFWLVGTGIVWATPASYHSKVLLQIPSDSTPLELKSQGVMTRAAEALGQRAGQASNPMASYLLWSSVTVAPGPAANLIQIDARCDRADEARRTVLAVAEAYRQHCREAASSGPSSASTSLPALIYIDPPEAAPAPVTDDTRVMLGIAGMAALCLLLCLPIIIVAERHMPALAGLHRVRATLPLPA